MDFNVRAVRAAAYLARTDRGRCMSVEEISRDAIQAFRKRSDRALRLLAYRYCVDPERLDAVTRDRRA